MFPNPQAALPLPTRPSLEQYKKLAKDLVKACRSNEANAIGVWAAKWIETLVRLAGITITGQLPVRIDTWVNQVEEFACNRMSRAEPVLADAHFVIARSHGFESWPKFAKHLEAITRKTLRSLDSKLRRTRSSRETSRHSSGCCVKSRS